MKSIWTQGPVRLHRPIKSRMKMLWMLWAAAFALLALWLAGLATNHMMGGWIHGLLAGAVIVTIPCIAYGVKYGEFLEPLLFRWKRNSRLRHSRPSPSVPAAPDESSDPFGRGPREAA